MKLIELAILFFLSLLIAIGCGYNGYHFFLEAFFLFLALFFLSSNKWLKWGLVFPLCLLAILYFQSGYIYGYPNMGVIASFLETNKRESLEFISAIPLKIWLLNVTLIALFFFYMIKISYPYKYKKTVLLLGVICFYFSSVSVFIKHIYVSSQHYITQINMLKKSLYQQANWKILNSHPKYKNYVLIVGESMRKDYMSAYGYPVNTTPFLKETNGLFVNGYISAASHTAISLPRTLSISHGLDIEPINNIITLANAAKIKTIWLSNQGFIGKYDTAVSAIAMHSVEKRFLKKGNFLSNNTSDYLLLPWFNKALLEPYNGSKLIVIHIMGSHENFCDRIKKDIYNLKDKDLSCYLSTYNQTDDIIKKVVNTLKLSNESYSLIYFSDHGLNNVSKVKQQTELVHGDLYKQNYEVPLIKISSDINHHVELDKKISAFDFMSIFSHWIGVETKTISALDIEHQPNVKDVQVLDGDQMINFDLLKNDPPVIL